MIFFKLSMFIAFLPSDIITFYGNCLVHACGKVKNLPVMQETQETWVQSLGQENPLEKEMATHSSIPAWKISWTEEPGGLYSPWGRKESDTTEHKHTQTHANLTLITYLGCKATSFCLYLSDTELNCG